MGGKLRQMTEAEIQEAIELNMKHYPSNAFQRRISRDLDDIREGHLVPHITERQAAALHRARSRYR